MTLSRTRRRSQEILYIPFAAVPKIEQKLAVGGAMIVPSVSETKKRLARSSLNQCQKSKWRQLMIMCIGTSCCTIFEIFSTTLYFHV